MPKIFFIMFCAAAVLTLNQAFSQPVEIEIKASKESFEPSSITLKKGEKVRIRFVSVDTTHGIHFGEFGMDTLIIPGQDTIYRHKVAAVEFTTEKTGKFLFPCVKYCSWRHMAGMQPKLAVEVVE